MLTVRVRTNSIIGRSVAVVTLVAVALTIGTHQARAAMITKFAVRWVPRALAPGPDGDVWFTESGNLVGRITPAGKIREFPTGKGVATEPQGIAAGPEGDLWFTQPWGNRIGRISRTGAVTQFSIGMSADRMGGPAAITKGPEGNMWFTQLSGSALEDNRIGRITPAGVVTEFSTGRPSESGAIPMSLEDTGITVGPDGNLWFTQPDDTAIGRITPAGVVTEFLTGRSPESQPEGIAVGRDGNLWFVEPFANRVGRMSPAGVLTEFSSGVTPAGMPLGITAGTEGNLWFTETNRDRIARMSAAGLVTGQLSTGTTAYGEPEAIIVGPDGNLWFTLPHESRIARLALKSALTRRARPCASIHALGLRFSVQVDRGSVSCATARQVLHTLFSGGGTEHRSAGSAQITFTIRAWSCNHKTTDGGVCVRGGANHRTAHDYIVGRITSAHDDNSVAFMAKELAREAEIAAEVLATDNNGSYSKVRVAKLHTVEPTISTTPRNNGAYLSAARSTHGGRGFEVVATATATGDTYTIARGSDGSIRRTCALGDGRKSGRGCQNGMW